MVACGHCIKRRTERKANNTKWYLLAVVKQFINKHGVHKALLAYGMGGAVEKRERAKEKGDGGRRGRVGEGEQEVNMD